MATGRNIECLQDIVQFHRPGRKETTADHRIRILHFSFESSMPHVCRPNNDQAIAQILLLANPRQLFSLSRLFIFCGGSIFRHMYGESKHIMDRLAYERLLTFYCQEWSTLPENQNTTQHAEIRELNRVFSTMILPGLHREERESGFQQMKNRMAGISLLKDRVMPFYGVEACVGRQVAYECFELMDFPFAYSHESPFPSKRMDDEAASGAFIRVFRKCAAFLS